jgi:hypothetical protein
VVAQKNSSFYHVMQIAAEQDERYAWVSEQFGVLTPSLLNLVNIEVFTDLRMSDRYKCNI